MTPNQYIITEDDQLKSETLKLWIIISVGVIFCFVLTYLSNSLWKTILLPILSILLVGVIGQIMIWSSCKKKAGEP